MRGLHLIQTETATGEAASLLTAVQRALGLTPNLAKAMASSPAALRGYMDFSGALRRGSLPTAVRERIALLVAQEHRCDYGLSAHTFLATKRGALTEGEAARARQGAAEDATDAAALCFAAALLRGHGDVTDDELATARDAGLTDGQLVEIVANVALGVFTDYLTKAGRVAVDWPLVRHTDQAPTPSKARRSSMQTPRKIAVAGATGRVGRHVADVLAERGHDVVAMSRASGVDLVTADGLAEALTGVEAVIDTATFPTPDQQAATEFFTTAARNLHELGERAGVKRIVEVSIIAVDRYTAGYSVAKFAHERAMLAGPVPVRILRAAQFHELTAQMLEWSRQGDAAYLPRMRVQPVAARTVAEALVDLALDPAPQDTGAPIPEIAGPREENLAEMARLLTARRGILVRIEEVDDPADPDRRLEATGGLLPNPHATLAGPTFKEWLDATT